MKLYRIGLLSVLGATLLVTACKKGPEDPFLSFRSRKVRLSGDWKVINYTADTTFKTTIFSGGTESREMNLSGSEFSITGTETFSLISPKDTDFTRSVTGTITGHGFTFDKEGNFSYNFDYTYDRIYPVVVAGTTVTEKVTVKQTIIREGKWYFAGRSKDYKNKENLVLSVISDKKSTETTTATGSNPVMVKTSYSEKEFALNERVEVWHLIELRNREIKMETDLAGLSSNKYTTTIGSGTPVIVEPGITQTTGKVFFQLKQ